MNEAVPFLVLAILMLINVPVAFCLAIAALAVLPWRAGRAVQGFIQRMLSATESFPLLAVPFFILAGIVMNHAGITGRIMNLADTLVGGGGPYDRRGGGGGWRA